MMLFLLKAAIVLSVLLGFYKLFLQKESFFSVNRAYLIIGIVLTFVLPFVTLPELVNHQGIVDKVVLDTKIATINNPSIEEIPQLTVEIPNAEIKESSDIAIPSNANTNKGVAYWIGLLYFFGVAILSLSFLTHLLGIFLKINRCKDRLKDGRCIILNQTEKTEPCSFFNYIFVNQTKYDNHTYTQILEHEKTHVQQLHSLDLIFAELAIIILWFNPLVWLYRKEVEKNIEYQTDALLLESKKVVSEDYQMNLLSIASYKKSNTLVSNYNQSLIKKRIVMMNKQKSNRNSYWKYAFLAPTLFVTLVLLNQPLSANAQESSIADFQEGEGDGISYEEDYENGDYDNLTPLLQAAAKGDELAVKSLLTNGAGVDTFVHGNGTALCLAIQNSNLKIAELLLRNGANPNLGSRSDGYPLMLAVSKGDIYLVKFLANQGVIINKKFPGDGSALIQASKDGNLRMVQTLIKLEADVDMPVKGDGNPLIMASKGGYLKVVEYLVKKGADVNYEVVGDEVPLIGASEQGHLEVVKYLVSKGADVNKVCKEKHDGKIRIRTALKMAKKKGHDEVVEFLKQKGAVD